MKIKLFQLQKNKRFNYTPRYYEGKEQGNAFEMGSRIRRDRETVTNHFTEEWRAIRSESRNNAGVNKTFWIVLAILILITLYFLDFDLSIFKRN